MQQRPAIATATQAKDRAADLLRAIRGGEKATGSADPPSIPRLTSSMLRAGTRMRLQRDAGADGALVILRHQGGKTRLPVTDGAVDLPGALPLGRAEVWFARGGHVSGPVNILIAGPGDAHV
jgi:hypothetical protein